MKRIDRLKPEDIAYWFFRLNGCLTIRDFTLHPVRKSAGSALSDVDVVAVRFPYRYELEDSQIGAMVDHELFLQAALHNRIYVALCEVKTGQARINMPWTRDDTVITKVLHRLGMFSYERVREVAPRLRETGVFTDENFVVQIVIACGVVWDDLSLPGVTQLTWKQHILPFIYQRLNRYRAYKSHIDTWSDDGKLLFQVAISAPSEGHFVTSIIDGFAVK